MTTLFRLIGGGLLLGALALASWLFINYRRDLAAANRRVDSGGRLIPTNCGPIEYGESGQGPAVLAIHGAGQGYDQGLWMAQQHLGENYRIVAPSRFGYLKSPIPEDSSIQAQADLYACLLDELGIDRVIVMGVSAGGPSALQFALAYPERTEALILASTFSFTTRSEADAQREAMIHRLVGSDFVYWLAINYARPLLFDTFGVTQALQASLTPADWEIADAAVEGMLPMSQRISGIKIDSGRRIPEGLPDGLPLQGINVPTLVLHARDDSLITYEKGLHIAGSIPGAKFVSFDTGGHLLLGRQDEARSEIKAFMDELAVSAALASN